MASFDISSEMNWQELDNAINQTLKEVLHRFDFRGIKSEIKMDKQASSVTLEITEREKMDSLKDVFQNKCVKRGLSLLSFEFEKLEDASGSGARQKVTVQAGISKDKGKEIVKAIKNAKFKVQAQIQDEQVRVSAKSRDALQEVMGFLRGQQDELKVPMQFGNYRG